MTSVFGAYDVAGSDFAGWVRLTNAVANESPQDRRIVVIDGTQYDLSFLATVPEESPSFEGARIPDRLQRLAAGDLELIETMDDGTFLFRVGPWIGGSPVAVLLGLGAVGGDWADLAVADHDTRLIVDAAGAPVQLMSEFTLAGPAGNEMRGTIHDEYSAFGLYVSIEEPGSSLYGSETSFDVQVGVDDHTMVTEPWIRVPADPATAATVDVAFAFPAGGVNLGIEGALGFLRAHDEQGNVIFDDLMPLDEGSSVLARPGPQTLVPYFRSCDGWCGLLDWPVDFCSVDTDLAAGSRYRLVVSIVDYETASCEFAPEAD